MHASPLASNVTVALSHKFADNTRYGFASRNDETMATVRRNDSIARNEGGLNANRYGLLE